MQPLALSPFSCPPLYKQSFYFIYSFFKINCTIQQFQAYSKIEWNIQRVPMSSLPPPPRINIPHETGRFITVDDPYTDTSLSTKSIVYVTCQCYVFYKFGQMHNDMPPPLQYHAEWLHCSKNPVSVTLHSSLLSSALATTVSIVLLFPQGHRVEIMYEQIQKKVCILFRLTSFTQ